MVILRPAEVRDSRSLWEWRNDPITRAASLDTRAVSWSDHEVWYEASLKSADRILLVAFDDADADAKQGIGVVRFDFESQSCAEVSINVAPDSRGRGTGTALLHDALAHVRETHPELALLARVRESNRASARIFEREGFVRVSASQGMLTLLSEAGSKRERP